MNLFTRLAVALFPGAFEDYFEAERLSLSRSWRSAPLQDARLDIARSTRVTLQGKSRDWERNSPLYAALADGWEQNVVGTGLQFKSASSNPAWNAVADDVYEQWKGVADIQSRFGWDNLQGVIARAVFVDGESFIQLTMEGSFPRVQVIEAHACETPDDRKAEEGKTICDGVQLDGSFARPVGYWFKSANKPQLIDAKNVIHIFEPGRIGQFRGIPYCAPALNVIHDLHDLRDLEMKAAKDAAELSTIIKTASGEMPTALATMAQKFATAAPGGSSVGDSKRLWYQTAYGGRNMVLQRGDEATQHVPTRPGADTREYWRLLASEICAVSGIPLALIYPESVQGTVYRGALDNAAAFFRAKTAVFATYFRRVRNFVIQQEARNNPKLRTLPDGWRKVTTGSVRAPNADAGRKSQAMIAELAAGLRTWSQIAAELGLDGRELLRQKADELVFIKQLAEERGLNPADIASATLQVLQQSQPAPPNDPE